MPDYYELRRYQLRNGPQARRLDDFLRDLAIPALNLYGVQPVGVFSALLGDASPGVYALLRHKSMDSVIAVRNWLSADPEFQKAVAFFHDVPASDPSFVRMDSCFLVAFDAMPELEVSPEAKENRPRIFELETGIYPEKACSSFKAVTRTSPSKTSPRSKQALV